MKTGFTKYLVSAVLVIAGCSGGNTNITSPNPPPPPPSNSISRLDPGPYLGYIVGFDALDAQQTAQANSLQSQALAAGQNFARAQFGWEDLELQPGVFETAELMLALDAATATGQSVFLSLSTLDTGSLTLPADLMSDDRLMPAAGLALDGPEIQARFHAFLDWLIPQLASYNVWGIAIANESTTNFSKVDQAAATRFLIDGVGYARMLDSDLAVTVTIVGEFFDPDVEQFASDLMPHLDFAMFNYYCLDGQTLLASDSAAWTSAVAAQINIAAGNEIFYQELGCPAGYGDLGGATLPAQLIGATPQLQEEFFRYMIDEIVAREELRGAYIFQLFDWSPALAELFTAGLLDPILDPNDPGSAITAERLVEWLMTVGMCRWSDSACRPAWDAYLDGVVRTANLRTSLTQ